MYKKMIRWIYCCYPRCGEKKVLTKCCPYAIIHKHSGSAPRYRGVEQLEARRAHNPEVVGSSPASATIKSTENNLFSVLFLCF